MPKYLLIILFSTGLVACKSKKEENQNKMPKTNSFYAKDNNGNEFKITGISKDEFEEYKDKGELKFCEQVYKEKGVEAYMLKNGNVIINESDNYAIYPSLKVLYSLLENYKGPYKKEVLFGLNIYGEYFPDKTDSIISSLYQELGIKQDLSTENRLQQLKQLDSNLINHRDSTFLDKHYLSLIAVIGNHIIDKYKNARWEMVLAPDKETWNPLINLDGKKVFFVDYIREDFMNPNIKEPLKETFETVCAIIQF